MSKSLEEREIKARKEPKAVKMSYLFSLAENKKNRIYLSVFFSILSGLCSFVPFVMVYRTALLILRGADASGSLCYGLIAAGALLLRFMFQAISAALSHIGAYNALYVVRKKLCEHIGRVNLGFFTESSTGDIKKVLMEDVERLETFLAHQIPDITVAIVVPSVVFLYLLTVNVSMALLLLVPVVLTMVILLAELVLAKPYMVTVPALQGRLNGALMQFVNGMPVMKAYHLTAETYGDFALAGQEYNRLWKRIASFAAPMSAVCKVIIESGVFFTLPLGGLFYLSGSLDAASYIFFMIMSIVFLSSYNNLMNFAQIFSQISAGLGRIKEVMDIPEIKNGSRGAPAKVSCQGIKFSQVSFAYQKTEVLQDITLELPGGTLTAFVGVSGAGKSTAAQLLPRFWDVTAGEISVGGINIKELQTEALMDMVSFVFQDAFMLEDTIYQNIAIGKAGCSQTEVEAAAKAAQIHDFICSLPQGYQTRIGTAGVKLSGGEKQRLCIARAILKDAPVLVFDEATSFTDIENEYKIQLALEELLRGKTTIMIAHRLHTIVHADKICVFSEGKIAETGTHHELVGRNGKYAKMWRAYTEQEVTA